MIQPFKVIIPARYGSTRLPGKVIENIGGKPLVQHVYETAKQSRASSVSVATDTPAILDLAKEFGATAILTAASHQSGTERLIEVIETLKEPDESILVNLQGDEFKMPSSLVDQVAESLMSQDDVGMATLCESITDEKDFKNTNIVKVIFNQHHFALNFTRDTVQWYGDGPALPADIFGYRHIGIYAYRAWFLRKYSRMQPCEREKKERLEQLRVLENGFHILVNIAKESPGFGIDTLEDLEKARKLVDI